MNRTIISICILLLSFNLSFAQEEKQEDQFTKDIRYLFTVSGSETNYKKTIKAMFSKFREFETNAPSAYWDKAEKEFLNTSITDITDMLIPIYKKYLSHEDIKAYIKFYESPAGQHIAQQQGYIMQESMQVGMLWGKTIGEKIKNDIEQKGYKIRLPFGL